MISAKLARHYAQEYNGRKIKTMKEVENHIKDMSALGFTNTGIDVLEPKVEKIAARLKEAGFKVYVYKKDSPLMVAPAGYLAVEIEWYK
jgi:signal recognition particle subunit SEC65